MVHYMDQLNGTHKNKTLVLFLLYKALLCRVTIIDILDICPNFLLYRSWGELPTFNEKKNKTERKITYV